MVKEKEDSLIYDLIFSDVNNFSIDISEYADDIYEYDEFIAKIKKILKKSKVDIIKSNIVANSKTVIWELSVKK